MLQLSGKLMQPLTAQRIAAVECDSLLSRRDGMRSHSNCLPTLDEVTEVCGDLDLVLETVLETMC